MIYRFALVALLASCASDPPPVAEPPAAPTTAPTPAPTPAPTTEAPAAPKHYEIEHGALKLPSGVAFETASDKIAASDTAIVYVKGFLTDKPDVTLLRIEGHVDRATPDAQALSEKRAMAAARALAAAGVDCKRLVPVGFGGTKPVEAGSAPQNTRVEFYMAALRGRPIGGMPADGGGKPAGDPCH